MSNEKETKKTLFARIKENFFKKAGAGLLIGFINGFFGSGGGIVAVQLMEKLEVEQKKAHATAILAILPLSIASALVYFLSGHFVFQMNTWYLLIGGSLGGLVGALLLSKLQGRWVNVIFTLLILASGIRMVF